MSTFPVSMKSGSPVISRPNGVVCGRKNAAINTKKEVKIGCEFWARSSYVQSLCKSHVIKVRRAGDNRLNRLPSACAPLGGVQFEETQGLVHSPLKPMASSEREEEKEVRFKMDSLPAQKSEERTFFPHESKTGELMRRKPSVHMALENLGFSAQPPAKAPMMRSKSRIGSMFQEVNNNRRSIRAMDGDTDILELFEDGEIPSEEGTPSEKFYVVKEKQKDVDYLGESTKGDMSVRRDLFDPCDNEGVASLRGPIEEVAKHEAKEAEGLLEKLKVPPRWPDGKPSRGIFCSRTLSLRSITTIGYDMDYTLVHYNVKAWEGRAYDYGLIQLKAMGYPVEGLTFDPDLVIRGLILDKEKGNLVKADRFGYVKRAMHGTRMISNRAIRYGLDVLYRFRHQLRGLKPTLLVVIAHLTILWSFTSELYGRELVDLRNERRWEFLNTLFSISEAGLYMQMVEKLDEGAVPPECGHLDYESLFEVVSKALFKAHVEGRLKDEIINNPDHFVELDPELPLALLDQKEAGKKLLLITNSDYHYTNSMMQYCFNQFLPAGMIWRDLFDMVIVSAKKPDFFTLSHPLYEVVTADGLMRPAFKAKPGGLYCGGSALMVEMALGVHGDETLYVGDHIYTDVSLSKLHLRWRTALIIRELEKEVKALAYGREHRSKLIELMNQKEVVGDVFNQLRLSRQRRTTGRAAQTPAADEMDGDSLADHMQKLLLLMGRLDQRIAPMLEADGQFFNPRWGYLSRAGLWDKSHLTRQIEKYADIYTSRVSNFLRYTPFMYFRSQSQTLAHDCDNHDMENAVEDSIVTPVVENEKQLQRNR
ncbi:hypothetical protein R1sor_014650 [Riccia sorocarpa]|uniref:5'-nucleotidase domain-containing protein 4 n=1 Tax=Riccia sorocarpa TaxID=122646 RepID=A0ABD3HBT8_9MARC